MFSSNSENRDACLDPALRKKAFSSSPLNKMLAVEFSKMPHHTEDGSLLFLVYWSFLHKKVLHSVKSLFCKN